MTLRCPTPRISAFAALLVFIAFSTATAQAQTIPFFITGSGEVVNGEIPLFVAQGPIDHTTDAGFGIKIGPHTGDGQFELVADADLATLTAQFQSTTPYEFRSSFGGNNVLACNYGVTTGELPADEPGVATLHSINAGADPNTPLDDTFIITFWAEFRPALDSCTGKFRRGRLKSGSFMMLAISGPVVLGPNGTMINADTVDPNNPEPMPYSWYGLGTLTFRFPFGLF